MVSERSSIHAVFGPRTRHVREFAAGRVYDDVEGRPRRGRRPRSARRLHYAIAPLKAHHNLAASDHPPTGGRRSPRWYLRDRLRATGGPDRQYFHSRSPSNPRGPTDAPLQGGKLLLQERNSSFLLRARSVTRAHRPRRDGDRLAHRDPESNEETIHCSCSDHSTPTVRIPWSIRR